MSQLNTNRSIYVTLDIHCHCYKYIKKTDNQLTETVALAWHLGVVKVSNATML